MAEKEAKKPAAQTGAAKFTKAQLTAAKKYQADVDVLTALLDDGKTYTEAEAQKLIADFKKRKVN